MKSVDVNNLLPVKPLQGVHFHLLFLRFLLEIFFGKQCRAVGQGAETMLPRLACYWYVSSISYINGIERHHAIGHVTSKASRTPSH